jgi:maltooligosyltrehalose synthase
VPCTTFGSSYDPDLTFDDAAGLVPYLAALSISDCYSAPCAITSRIFL